MSVAEARVGSATIGWGAELVPPEQPDEEIVERVLAGEKELFATLMRRYNQRLYRIVWSILVDPAEAEDVVQDAYVRAFQHLDQFDGRARFATWLTKIAVYEASARRKKRRRLLALDTLEPHTKETLMTDRSDPLPNGEERAFAREVRSLLERAVVALPPLYRQVFVLREVEGLSNGEAAESLGLTRTAAKVRLFRARRQLRRELERLTDGAAAELLSFAGERCDRIVAGVMARIAEA